MKISYIVINPEGEAVLQSTIRYPRHIELDLLENGFTIKLNGNRLTKTAIRKEGREHERILG